MITSIVLNSVNNGRISRTDATAVVTAVVDHWAKIVGRSLAATVVATVDRDTRDDDGYGHLSTVVIIDGTHPQIIADALYAAIDAPTLWLLPSGDMIDGMNDPIDCVSGETFSARAAVVDRAMHRTPHKVQYGTAFTYHETEGE